MMNKLVQRRFQKHCLEMGGNDDDNVRSCNGDGLILADTHGFLRLGRSGERDSAPACGRYPAKRDCARHLGPYLPGRGRDPLPGGRSGSVVLPAPLCPVPVPGNHITD